MHIIKFFSVDILDLCAIIGVEESKKEAVRKWKWRKKQ